MLAQLCLPDRRIELRTVAAGDKQVRLFDPAGTTGDYWPGYSSWKIERPDGIYSAGSVQWKLADRTVLGQPVVQYFTSRRPVNIVAFSVSRGRGADKIDYWFTLPHGALTSQFTAWLSPVSQEDEAIRKSQQRETWSLVVHGGDLPIHAVTSAPTPKMRFRLQTNREDPDERDRFWPAVYAVRAQLDKTRRAPETSAGPRPEFAPVSDVDVPGC